MSLSPVPLLHSHPFGGFGLSGTDLGDVYPQLSGADKRQIARQLVDIQRAVATLPKGPGYGYVTGYDQTSPASTWAEVVQSSLSRSRLRIEKIGVVDAGHVDRVLAHARDFEDYFARTPPTPFLDDITTKNVIVHEGELSGIVDVDVVCFGDSLFAIALTKMSLLSSGYATDYTDFWCDELGLTEEQRRAIQFYTAIFCVDFMSELGQRFNKDHAEPIDPAEVAHLTNILDHLLTDGW